MCLSFKHASFSVCVCTTHTRTRTHMCARAHTRARTHTHIHTHARAYACTRTCTLAHLYAQSNIKHSCTNASTNSSKIHVCCARTPRADNPLTPRLARASHHTASCACLSSQVSPSTEEVLVCPGKGGRRLIALRERCGPSPRESCTMRLLCLDTQVSAHTSAHMLTYMHAHTHAHAHTRTRIKNRLYAHMHPFSST